MGLLQGDACYTMYDVTLAPSFVRFGSYIPPVCKLFEGHGDLFDSFTDYFRWWQQWGQSLITGAVIHTVRVLSATIIYYTTITHPLTPWVGAAVCPLSGIKWQYFTHEVSQNICDYLIHFFIEHELINYIEWDIYHWWVIKGYIPRSLVNNRVWIRQTSDRKYEQR